MSLTKIGSIGINTGIQFAGVTTISTLNSSSNVLSVGGTVNFVSDVSIGGTGSLAGTLTYEDVKLLKNAPIPQGSSLEFMAGNKVVLETTDTLTVDSDTNSSVDAALTIMEIT